MPRLPRATALARPTRCGSRACAVWSAVAYEDPARALVRALKYRGAPGLADPLAAADRRRRAAPDCCARRRARAVPMPAARRRRRGYNQAERIAAALARRTGLEVRECLARGAGTRQVGRGRQQRLLDTGRDVRSPARPPRRVVLVDDVATTGATLAACAAALARRGARSVAAVTYARTPGR